MTQNRELFLVDPTTFTIPNEGVAKIYEPQTEEQWAVLRYELNRFVCEGEYRRGLERVLSTFLTNLNNPEQPAVWVSGFYGSGKSHFVRWLCSPLPHLLVEGPIDPENKDDQLRLISCWVWEVAELGSTTRKADREALKHFLTVRQVTVRKPYGKHDLVKPAMASFIGTVNNEGGVLSDPTGSRRFMSVDLLSIDWKYADMDVNQVWAQAGALYRSGEPWELQGEEKAQAEEANADYEVEDPLTGYFHRCFTITKNPDDRVPTCDILDRLHGTGWRGLSKPRAEAMAVGSTLRSLGLEQYRSGSARGWCGLVARGIRL